MGFVLGATLVNIILAPITLFITIVYGIRWLTALYHFHKVTQ
jgi:hypothetical protein